MTAHAPYDEQGALYALGALDAAECTAFERHLNTCTECRRELAAWRETVHLLPYALASQAPPPGLKARVLAAAAAGNGPATGGSGPVPFAPPTRRPAIWPHVGWAAALLIAIVGGYLRAASLEQQLARQEGTLAVLRQQMVQQREMVEALDARQVSMFQLAGQRQAPGAMARVFWNQERNVWLFYVHNLPPPPPGKTYQLWFITKAAQKISAGTFAPDKSAPMKIQVPPAAKAIAAAAVTLEPAGGMPQPTGDIWLVGKPST